MAGRGICIVYRRQSFHHEMPSPCPSFSDKGGAYLPSYLLFFCCIERYGYYTIHEGENARENFSGFAFAVLFTHGFSS